MFPRRGRACPVLLLLEKPGQGKPCPYLVGVPAGAYAALAVIRPRGNDEPPGHGEPCADQPAEVLGLAADEGFVATVEQFLRVQRRSNHRPASPLFVPA